MLGNKSNNQYQRTTIKRKNSKEREDGSGDDDDDDFPFGPSKYRDFSVDPLHEVIEWIGAEDQSRECPAPPMKQEEKPGLQQQQQHENVASAAKIHDRKTHCSFAWAKRIDYGDLTEELVRSHVFEKGLPLVCGNTTKAWKDFNRENFSWRWLRDHFGDTPMCPGPRDVERLTDMEGWTVRQYIDYIDPQHQQQHQLLPRPQQPRTRTAPKQQRNPPANNKAAKRSNNNGGGINNNNNNDTTMLPLPYPILYGKDMPVPPQWRAYINDRIHPSLTYKTKGDILGDVPPEIQIETNMVYMGYHGTQTPSHHDRCGTSGQNLLVYADDPENTSCLWFMAGSKDAPLVEKFFQEQQKHNNNGGGNIEVSIHADNYFMPLDRLRHAPYTVYVVNQREGDLVLVPPRGAHQAINRGPGINVKFAWSRLPVYQIASTIRDVLPLYRSVGRAEVYRVRASAWFGLKKRTQRALEILSTTSTSTSKVEELKHKSNNNNNDSEIQTLLEEIPILAGVMEEIAQKEYIDTINATTTSGNDDGNDNPLLPQPIIHKYMDEIPFKRYCDLCQADIFNRCFHYHSSNNNGNDDGEEEEEEVDICIDCAAEGKLVQYILNRSRGNQQERTSNSSNKRKRKRKQQKQQPPMVMKFGIYETIPREELEDTIARAWDALRSLQQQQQQQNTNDHGVATNTTTATTEQERKYLVGSGRSSAVAEAWRQLNLLRQQQQRSK